MKKRSREINIFSVSALDLFASALGAFILMCLIFMMFFTMTSRTPQVPDGPGTDLAAALARVAELELALSEAEAQASSNSPNLVEELRRELARSRADAERATAELRQALTDRDEAITARDQALAESEALRRDVSATEVPPIDLVLCLDISGSMSDHIEGLKRQISDLAEIMNEVAPTGFGVIAFGDRYWDRPIFTRDVTTDVDELRDFIDSLEVNLGLGGGSNTDNPEALALALERALALRLRPESQSKTIVVISDHPAYPERVATAIDRARNFAAIPGQHVSAIMVNGLNTGRSAESFMLRLARAGNGEFIDADNRTLIGSVLLAVFR